MMEIPEWIQYLLEEKLTKKKMVCLLQRKTIKSTFPTKKKIKEYIEKQLCWPWNLPWRNEQKKVISLFFEKKQDIIVQAIFGGGKTTMMLAIIFILCLRHRSTTSKIFLCAFNVSIRNELIKKTRILGKLNIRTYDSLIYQCCKEMNYEPLEELNFEGKRRFVRENKESIKQQKEIEYVFIDETQDLELSCYGILKKRFPNAKFMFVGDVFQSVQKEPRESLLWNFINNTKWQEKEKYETFFMMDTPRVPALILEEIKEALIKYYPEFSCAIPFWKSSSNYILQQEKGIEWVPFSSYRFVYQNLEQKIKNVNPEEVMILTFSSAITVRGSLGDIARFRKYFQSKGYSINSNHKKMMDDRLFLTTANSSKGLERDIVYCVLTFPLELAFSNFSDDLVMNLITVALSRCKQKIVFYVPEYIDRFSKVLRCFVRCPSPHSKSQVASTPLPITKEITKKKEGGGGNTKKEKGGENTKKEEEGKKYNKKAKKPFLECNTFQYDPTNIFEMLEMEHSTTEVLRQNIIKYETRQLLLRYIKQIGYWNLTDIETIKSALSCIKTEEECAFTGILFESLLLTLWTFHFPSSLSLQQIQHHDLFSGHISKIQVEMTKYQEYMIQNSRFLCHSNHGGEEKEKKRFVGCCMYARLHLFCHQKIWIEIDHSKEQVLFRYWNSLLPSLQKIPFFLSPAAVVETSAPEQATPLPTTTTTFQKKIKTQVNITMPFLKGIMDAVCVFDTSSSSPEEEEKTTTNHHHSNKKIAIYEIKASRSTDWKEKTLLQTLLYGLMNGQALFTIYLVNVFSKKVCCYRAFFQKDLMWLRSLIIQDILNWNLNCFLAKNIQFHRNRARLEEDPPKKIRFHPLTSIIIDGRFDVLSKKLTQCCIAEFQSSSKVLLTSLVHSSSFSPCFGFQKKEEKQEHRDIYSQLHSCLQKYISIYDVETIFVSPFLFPYLSYLPSGYVYVCLPMFSHFQGSFFGYDEWIHYMKKEHDLPFLSPIKKEELKSNDEIMTLLSSKNDVIPDTTFQKKIKTDWNMCQHTLPYLVASLLLSPLVAFQEN
ncbi:MAG: hypothetical protein EBR40_10415 [Proteobacteria bacterium]|nr:hypothetical protein [Pseudomonadota bacterium]